MNYTIEIVQPDGNVVFKGRIDLTPTGLAVLKEKLLAIKIGREHRITEIWWTEMKNSRRNTTNA